MTTLFRYAYEDQTYLHLKLRYITHCIQNTILLGDIFYDHFQPLNNSMMSQIFQYVFVQTLP